jgi:hypothetical protein
MFLTFWQPAMSDILAANDKESVASDVKQSSNSASGRTLNLVKIATAAMANQITHLIKPPAIFQTAARPESARLGVKER